MLKELKFGLRIFVLTLFAHHAQARVVQYELNVEKKTVNISGKSDVDFALTVNGGLPAPTLEFTEGDEAEILVKNEVPDQEVSIHWHGILLPPLEDGVAYVSTPPIFPGSSRLFKFKIRQHGTYWYHSHTALQEQKGVYGAFIIHPKQKAISYDRDLVVVLSDWTDENPDQVLRNLKKDGDYYLHKKDSVRSYLGAFQAGALKAHLSNEWSRMGGMDLSDVGYDAFLVNGKKDPQLLSPRVGEKIRLRIINAAASTYFYVSLGQLPMKVISADGVDVTPMNTKEILMGMAETYDVLFSMPDNKNFELRATAQDGSGWASGWIGQGSKIFAVDRPHPEMYASMDHATHQAMGMNHSTDSSPSNMDHSMHHMPEARHHKAHSGESPSIESLSVDQLRAQTKTTLPNEKSTYEVKLVLGGDMSRYVWHINRKAIHEDRTLSVNEGDVVRYTFVNETMMHHPMHLHGHFFRVLTEQGEYSPLKHTVDVPPHASRTIEFLANEPGQWMFHCHNLYHMKTGMARILSYSGFKPPAEILAMQAHDPHLHDHTFFMGRAEAFTNHGEIFFRGTKTWDAIDIRAETKKDGDHWENEADLLYRHWISNFSSLVAGGTNFHEESRGILGFTHLLPLLFETTLTVDSRGKGRWDLGKRFQWTKYFFTDAEIKWRDGFNADWVASLLFANSWSWAAGIKFTEGTIGFGLQYKF